MSKWTGPRVSSPRALLRRTRSGAGPPPTHTGDHDIPGDYAPDGSRIAFLRVQPEPPGECPVRREHRWDGPAAAHPMGPAQKTPGAGHPTVGGSCSPSQEESCTSSAQMAAGLGDPAGHRSRQLLRVPAGMVAQRQADRVLHGPESAGYEEDIFTARADGTDLRRVTNMPDTEEFGGLGRTSITAWRRPAVTCLERATAAAARLAGDELAASTEDRLPLVSARAAADTVRDTVGATDRTRLSRRCPTRRWAQPCHGKQQAD